jgi:hypothetical protein
MIKRSKEALRFLKRETQKYFFSSGAAAFPAARPNF